MRRIRNFVNKKKDIINLQSEYILEFVMSETILRIKSYNDIRNSCCFTFFKYHVILPTRRMNNLRLSILTVAIKKHQIAYIMAKEIVLP